MAVAVKITINVVCHNWDRDVFPLLLACMHAAFSPCKLAATDFALSFGL